VSIVSGSAPRSSVTIVITGNSTRGKRSIPIERSATTPNTTKAMTIMVVKTGRRIATSERSMGSRGGGRKKEKKNNENREYQQGISIRNVDNVIRGGRRPDIEGRGRIRWAGRR